MQARCSTCVDYQRVMKLLTSRCNHAIFSALSWKVSNAAGDRETPDRQERPYKPQRGLHDANTTNSLQLWMHVIRKSRVGESRTLVYTIFSAEG